MKQEYTITLHPYKNGYIADTNLRDAEINKYNDYELILIVDRSGSMWQSYPILINKLIPYLLDKLNFPENKPVHFITFEDYVDYRMFTKKDFLNCKESAPGAIEKMTDVFPQLRKIFKPENKNKSFRMLTLSDGEIVVEEERKNVPILASELSQELRGKFRINSQAIRYFTSSAQPDTLALASLLQLNTVKEATLIDIKWDAPCNESGDQIYTLFNNDGLDCDIKIKSNKKCIKQNPWSDVAEEVSLFLGKNMFWVENYDDTTEFILRINNQDTKMNVIKGEDINLANYSIILSSKISEILNKLKILKIVNSENSKKELENIIEQFKKFEDSLEKKEEEDISLKDGKMASRIIYLKKLINKRKGLISNQMDKIQNDNRLAQFNSQQTADYLRNVEDTKLGKSLAKRALNSGDLREIALQELKEMFNNINELDKVDLPNEPISFYSTCTTTESLKELKNSLDDSLLNDLQLTELLKLFNVVGIACSGKVGEYPDPSVYIVSKIYPGCYISIADIVTAEEFSKGNKHLEVPGVKEEINNCIPIFQNKQMYNLLRKCSTILELLAGLGMRRVLAQIPLTLESLILSGLWRIVGVLKTKKSEVNIQAFLEIWRSMQFVCEDKYNDVIDIIKEQLKDKNDKNGLYMNSYGLYQMLPVLYHCAKNKIFNKKQMQKIFRAMIRFEIYKSIRGKIRKEKKEDFAKTQLNEALGIDFEKYGTKLPPLFEKKVDPQFNDQFYINKEIIKGYLKSIGWTELIPYSYLLFSCLSDDDIESFEKLKNLEEYKLKDLKEDLGITYDYDKFIIFNAVQSLIFKEKIDREDEVNRKMKILDSNNEVEIDKFLKEQTKHIYSAEYQMQNQKQIKKQFEIISSELVDKILSSKDLSEFKNLMKNGITKGYLTHIISNCSTKGYIELKKQILNDKVDIPLRYEKIKALLIGRSEKGEGIWNKGNPLRTQRKDYELFLKKNNPQLLEEIEKMHIDYNYREKMNRQGHSNIKRSYWALGYDTLEEFYKKSKKKDVELYKKIHYNCCGLGLPENRIKNLKKKEKKLKRKEFRQKKKKGEQKNDDKMDIIEKNEFGRRGFRRRRGFRNYRKKKVTMKSRTYDSEKIALDEEKYVELKLTNKKRMKKKGKEGKK